MFTNGIVILIFVLFIARLLKIDILAISVIAMITYWVLDYYDIDIVAFKKFSLKLIAILNNGISFVQSNW